MTEIWNAMFPARVYENFSFSNYFLPLDAVLIALYVGAVIAAALNCYRRVYLGRAVRGLIAKNAFSEESALPAVKNEKQLARAVKRGTYGKLIVRTDDGRYYVPEEKRYEAETRYEKKGSGIGTVILTAIILIPVLLGVRWLIPEILQMFDNVLSGF